MKLKSIVAAALALAVSTAANAALVIDQNQPDASIYMAGFYLTDLAQSFQQSAGNIAGAGIFLAPDLGSGLSVFTISLWTDLPNAAGASLLTSGQASSSISGVWLDVFWTPLAITPDTTYFLVFTEDQNIYGIMGGTSNPYSRGQTYGTAGFEPFPDVDYAFRTYADATRVAVPAPAALGLLGLGLIGLGLARRRV